MNSSVLTTEIRVVSLPKTAIIALLIQYHRSKEYRRVWMGFNEGRPIIDVAHTPPKKQLTLVLNVTQIDDLRKANEGLGAG